MHHRVSLYLLTLFTTFVIAPTNLAADPNRLVYLDEANPFYPGTTFPRLTTPQWIGEPGVDLVVTLGIDDMSGHSSYEAYLRPLLERLKAIDGRAPVSIFCNTLNPAEPHLQQWLKEGLSLEVHTLSHPCPILAKGDFASAENTVHGGIAWLNTVPNAHPVAFRTPCCDSINSASPRVFDELLARTNALGQFLRMDSSVAMIFTTNDTSLPLSALWDAANRPRFRKYVPFPAFATTLENYPFPYVHSQVLWEMPFVVPSDWESQNLQGNAHPQFLEDWLIGLDLVAAKQGTFNTIFHPANWSSPAQHVSFIDRAVKKYGQRLRFLTYREVHDRLTRHLLAGEALRANDGGDNGVRLLDLNDDGFLDVLVANDRVRQTRIWNPTRSAWTDSAFPVALVSTTAITSSLSPRNRTTGVQFGVIHPQGDVSCLIRSEVQSGAWTFRNGAWQDDPALLRGLELNDREIRTHDTGRDRGVRLRNVDGTGMCELLVSNESQNGVFTWSESDQTWKRLTFRLPPETSIVDAEGHDNGLRFADINDDGFEDVLFSNATRYAVWLFVPEPFLGWNRGWNRKVLSSDASAPPAPRELPAFVRAGSHRNNGAWIHSRHLWWQNEDTASLPHLVDRRSFDQLLIGVSPPPKSPAQSLASLRLPAGFRAELMAAEPLVQDPIALDWSADGRLWVLEMRDYPLGIDGSGKPGGVLKVLTDSDADGRFDQATEFIKDIAFPSGLMPWRRGVLISAAPDILYAEDTDGDGRADKREVLFRGFVEGNQQHRVNGFALGLDGWIYGANGDSGGEIRLMGRLDGVPVKLGAPISIRGRDFRFRPDTGDFESIEGQTQYGRWRDDQGRWFGNANYTWLWTYQLPSYYIARNPQLMVRDLRTMLASYEGGQRVYPISRPLQRPKVVGDDNHVTSANSPTPYRDDLFGLAFEQSVFVSEPTENLVHREVLIDSGFTLTSRRAPTETTNEFLASTDNWFRPIQTRTGPDGALWIADMYRLSIEHPEWIPKDLQARLNLRAGEDRGRIYRILPTDAPARPVLPLDRMDTFQLVAAMESPNGWHRDTAMRLLWERRPPEASEPLAAHVHRSMRWQTRLQALATLHGLGAATPGLVTEALSDQHPAVRVHALQVAESWLKPTSKAHVSLESSILALESDPTPSVALQLAFTLGELADPRSGSTLIRLAQRHPGDVVLRTAVLSSAVPHLSAMMGTLTQPTNATGLAELLEPLLVLAAHRQHRSALSLGMTAAFQTPSRVPQTIQLRIGASLLEVLDRRRGEPDPENTAIRDQLEPLIASAQKLAVETSHSESARMAALRLYGRGRHTTPADWDQLAQLLSAQHPLTIQQAALAAFRRDPSSRRETAEAVLRQWPALSPSIRGVATELLLAKPDWTRALLQAMDEKRLVAADLGPATRQSLLNHPDAALRSAAAKTFEAVVSDRQAVVHTYRALETLPGDPEKGRRSFQTLCASCHRLRGEGFPLGPDLAAIGDTSIPSLLISILDPNRSVPEPFTAYRVITRSGAEFTGVIAAESPNNLTLHLPGGGEETLLRTEVVSLAASRQSLMPEGFETSLDPGAMADLLAFITSSGTHPK